MSRTFDEMGTLGSPSPTRRPTMKSRLRRLERCCCRTFTYFPLAFVYGLTTWAVWVELHTSFLGAGGVGSYIKAALGAGLWALANASYSIAVFTNPGSPLDEPVDLSLRSEMGKSRWKRKKGGRAGYEGVPTHEVVEEGGGGGDGDDTGRGGGGIAKGFEDNMTMVTAKASGQPRFCKKCACVKPDRTHHCSSCGQCVLKMDHHCPWLATCVGLRNYKPFLLFLTYTSVFCWACFAVTATWVWAEIMDDVKMEEGLMVVNVILLAVLAGVIGLVLTGFTAWHFYLAITGQTTIESLEKTRYLSPLRKTLEPEHPGHRHTLGGNGGDDQTSHRPLTDQLKEIHANALPGVLRPEEGETSSGTTSRSLTPNPYPSNHGTPSTPAHTSLHRTFASLEAQREHDRYNAYLDEVDSEKLPNAFDNGWRRNLLHIFGPEPLFWALPVCNTTGDGWSWEISSRWEEARGEVARGREARRREEEFWGETGNGPFGGTLELQQRQQRQMDGRGGGPSPSMGARGRERGFEGPAMRATQRKDFKWVPGQGFVDVAPPAPSQPPPPQQFPRSAGAPPPPPRNKKGGGTSSPCGGGSGNGSADPSTSDLPMQPLDRKKAGTAAQGAAHSSSSDSDSDSDEDEEDRAMKRLYNNNSIYGYPGGGEEEGEGGNWNDVPEEYLRRGKSRKEKAGKGGKARRGRWKGD
ncbi:zf-DHHC-domain-containing protein [Hortaea werneckii]|uniref:Palmitoyltransferase n=1 Tax=Hortaea werneckii TaxID=91943 RepID=A0A3M7I098_HORWE|nr:zf-DHHC-domain-containing protein [Hortaea werneckii]KAI6792014.1 zf-DHHC-domain-containing protein [Hortaea werneckii]KAI6894199.1 zf-DHHC-domain-containing protein [Hortaea werneckii]KAI6918602.1 zf-DHHC-domain-containing protein [Hortaea werneckii]KAI6952079.1 zf-DHHC-domain-containing protein [Hortaea werneckii]